MYAGFESKIFKNCKNVREDLSYRRRREWETENFGFLPVISDFFD